MSILVLPLRLLHRRRRWRCNILILWIERLYRIHNRGSRCRCRVSVHLTLPHHLLLSPVYWMFLLLLSFPCLLFLTRFLFTWIRWFLSPFLLFLDWWFSLGGCLFLLGFLRWFILLFVDSWLQIRCLSLYWLVFLLSRSEGRERFTYSLLIWRFLLV